MYVDKMWFDKFFGDKITPEFKKFFEDFYGTPDQYLSTEDEQNEYWLRCGFAWIGWSAALEYAKKEQ